MAYSRSTRVKHSILAGWKWMLSFRTHDWRLDDYPVVVRKQDDASDPFFDGPRFSKHKYVACILKWGVLGGGETASDAMAELTSNFEMVKRRRSMEGASPVRPGTTVPIEFASDETIKVHEALSEDFITRILGVEWAWISDESTLWDFHVERENDHLNTRIRETYGVDVSDIKSGSIAKILERIEQSRAQSNPSD